MFLSNVVGDASHCPFTKQAVFWCFTDVGVQFFGSLGGSHKREIKNAHSKITRDQIGESKK